MRAVQVWAWRGKLRIRVIREAGDSESGQFFLCSLHSPTIPALPLVSKGNTWVEIPADVFAGCPEAFHHEGDWRLCHGTSLTPVYADSIVRMGFLFHTPRISMQQGQILFPLGGEKGSLKLRLRKKQWFDGAGFWWKERLCFAWFVVGRFFPAKYKNLVIYEKFCKRAEDNGFALFRHCMRHLAPSLRKHVYFILDPHTPSYRDLRRDYGRQIVPFLSFRHLKLLLTAGVYAASESRTHAFGWKAVPGPIIHEIKTGNHPILFLQHGVTALKKVDDVFGAQSSDSMTWFAVTGKAEQKIIARYFGYPVDRIPVLGFPRWDLLRKDGYQTPRFFLYMPTWRKWLEDCSAECFLASEYYHSIQDFLQDSALLSMLSQTGTRLVVCLHPKFISLSSHFSVPSEAEEWITISREGETAVSHLIEACSALVTDYSSVGWDACYLEKPVLFYQFDRERYQKETGSYLNLDRDLFGPSFGRKEDLIAEMRDCAAGNFQERSEYALVRSRWFAYQDHQNCQRVLDFLEDRGWPYSIKS